MEETEKSTAAKNAAATDREERYKRLKNRYTALQQQHLKTHSEYRQSMEEVHELRAKKQYLQRKLAEILKRISCEPEEFGLELPMEADD